MFFKHQHITSKTAQNVYAKETEEKQREACDKPNRLRFVLPISSHVTILLGSFSTMLFFALMT